MSLVIARTVPAAYKQITQVTHSDGRGLSGAMGLLRESFKFIVLGELLWDFLVANALVEGFVLLKLLFFCALSTFLEVLFGNYPLLVFSSTRW